MAQDLFGGKRRLVANCTEGGGAQRSVGRLPQAVVERDDAHSPSLALWWCWLYSRELRANYLRFYCLMPRERNGREK